LPVCANREKVDVATKATRVKEIFLFISQIHCEVHRPSILEKDC
jgi:hypothetical protein